MARQGPCPRATSTTGTSSHRARRSSCPCRRGARAPAPPRRAAPPPLATSTPARSETLVRSAHEAEEHIGNPTTVRLTGLVLVVRAPGDVVAAVRDAAAPVPGGADVVALELGVLERSFTALARERARHLLPREVPEVDVHVRAGQRRDAELAQARLDSERAEAGLLTGTGQL